MEGIDLTNIPTWAVVVIVFLIVGDRLGMFSAIKSGTIALYKDVTKDKNKVHTNGNVAIAKESLDIIRESQKLVLLDIPHKLDEAIDELHSIRKEMRDLVGEIKGLTDEIRRDKN